MNPEQQRRQLALEKAIEIARVSPVTGIGVEEAAKAILAVARQVDAYLLGKDTDAEARKS